MKLFRVLLIVPFLASCVPSATKELTRSAGDAKTLQSYAILRPKWPDPMKPELRFDSVRTAVNQTTARESRGIHGSPLSDIGNMGLILEPGPCAIHVRSGAPPLTSWGTIEFTAQKGKIYRFRAMIDPALKGMDDTHLWELYEEDTNKVILRREMKASYTSPVIMPVVVAR
ncbi:hypothetical protein [Luteolibacter luteus]|uniref:Uncharacterized protein n=1 Tax=Luteolibacter luteus TaxID=2728835 RepID=A0A858RJA5_9BACT|nr:hypothetical protein [Luteolibacter luteus]QJE96997.1 hypothetical protein HHL09_14780 [Luteolibacter luteus]